MVKRSAPQPARPDEQAGPASRWRRHSARLVSALLALHLGTAWCGEPAIAVVVAHGGPHAAPLSLALLSGIYARKRLLWDDGSAVMPINLPLHHPVRQQFSRLVFRQSPQEMQAYWNDEYFHGVQPPSVLGSEEAVVRYVAANPGAVGYVSACLADRRVDVVAVLEPPQGAMPCPKR